MTENKFNKSKYIPFGLIYTGTELIETDQGKASPNGILIIGNYTIDFTGDNRDRIMLSKKAEPLCNNSRHIKIDKMIFEKIIDNAFEDLWNESETRTELDF